MFSEYLGTISNLFWKYNTHIYIYNHRVDDHADIIILKPGTAAF